MDSKSGKYPVPDSEVNKLRNVPAELKGGEELEGGQRVTSIGKVLNNYIQVFMWNPDSVIIPPALENLVQGLDNKVHGLDNKIHELENKIQDLTNTIQNIYGGVE